MNIIPASALSHHAPHGVGQWWRAVGRGQSFKYLMLPVGLQAPVAHDKTFPEGGAWRGAAVPVRTPDRVRKEGGWGLRWRRERVLGDAQVPTLLLVVTVISILVFLTDKGSQIAVDAYQQKGEQLQDDDTRLHRKSAVRNVSRGPGQK